MKLGYVLFAFGVVGVGLWSAGLSASTTAAMPAQPVSECMYTQIGDLAACI